VASYGGVLGAAVSCSDRGGFADDDFTTCLADQALLLDRLFDLAAARGLDVDLHVDENGNAESVGLAAVAAALARRAPPFGGRVTCGHCCALAAQPPGALASTLAVAAAARITVVSLPSVNLWLQDRDEAGARTPRRRGVTLLKELAAAGVPTALASDNTRDQFYGYGDLDMLEIFREAVRIGHLDRPFGAWPAAVTCTPAAAMGLREGAATLGMGCGADFIVFRGRSWSELLSRPQADRLVVRGGAPCGAAVPDYSELDDLGGAGGGAQAQAAAPAPA
jgi:cytosine/adenosine deaminase-related metal-dependent hydrolase